MVARQKKWLLGAEAPENPDYCIDAYDLFGDRKQIEG